MFRATTCPKSGETTVFMQHLLLCVDDWLVCRSICSCIIFLACLLLSSTCFGQIRAEHQEKQLCLCNTCYSVWMTGWYAGAYAPAYQTVIRSFFHSSLLCTFPATLLHQPVFHPLCLCDNWYLLFCVDDCLVCQMFTKYAWGWVIYSRNM